MSLVHEICGGMRDLRCSVWSMPYMAVSSGVRGHHNDVARANATPAAYRQRVGVLCTVCTCAWWRKHPPRRAPQAIANSQCAPRRSPRRLRRLSFAPQRLVQSPLSSPSSKFSDNFQSIPRCVVVDTSSAENYSIRAILCTCCGLAIKIKVHSQKLTVRVKPAEETKTHYR